jgi:hypothetical protein
VDGLPVDYADNLPVMAQARDEAMRIKQEAADRAARRGR